MGMKDGIVGTQSNGMGNDQFVDFPAGCWLWVYTQPLQRFFSHLGNPATKGAVIHDSQFLGIDSHFRAARADLVNFAGNAAYEGGKRERTAARRAH